MVRLRADSKTESFKKLYASRAPVIEGVFAEAKHWHGRVAHSLLWEGYAQQKC
jgi:hypothetical protein